MQLVTTVDIIMLLRQKDYWVISFNVIRSWGLTSM